VLRYDGAMRQLRMIGALLAIASVVTVAGTLWVQLQAKVGAAAGLAAKLRGEPASPTDLQIAGDVPVRPPGMIWYLARADLLSLAQVRFTVSNDVNFQRPMQVSGVPLEDLVRDLGVPAGDMVIAISKDHYQANYPHDYLIEHHPLLVLEINGQSPPDWPKNVEGLKMGPYMISHEKFTPAFHLLAHADEPQIPWGVVRLDFRDEKLVFAAIAPPGPLENRPAVQAGYQIARQNCFRCHNAGDQGGKKSGVTWAALSAIATASPDFFHAYIRDPNSKSPQAQMPANPDYDDATLDALTAYFRSFPQSGSQ
jgi:mono/diheme cytochrome c family protein